jgi:hypothetical protein
MTYIGRRYLSAGGDLPRPQLRADGAGFSGHRDVVKAATSEEEAPSEVGCAPKRA